MIQEYSVIIQNYGYYLFDEPRKQFSLRPDIALRKNDRIIIMDIKWKKLINNERKNYGIAQSDMYQMYAYSKKYQTEDIYLLFPMNKEMINTKQISFHSQDHTLVKIFCVDVSKIEQSINQLKEDINQ